MIAFLYQSVSWGNATTSPQRSRRLWSVLGSSWIVQCVRHGGPTSTFFPALNMLGVNLRLRRLQLRIATPQIYPKAPIGLACGGNLRGNVSVCLRLPAEVHGCRRQAAPNLPAARALAFAASSSRLFGGALVSSERRRRIEMPVTSSTAARNEPSLAFDGLLKPLIFLTNCSEAARTSSSVTGGSKLKSVLIFLHISMYLEFSERVKQGVRRTSGPL